MTTDQQLHRSSFNQLFRGALLDAIQTIINLSPLHRLIITGTTNLILDPLAKKLIDVQNKLIELPTYPFPQMERLPHLRIQPGLCRPFDHLILINPEQHQASFIATQRQKVNQSSPFKRQSRLPFSIPKKDGPTHLNPIGLFL
ncbi:hypothetical protein, variant, partial [Puccinia triticina 1-1 BBBD Race 1]